MLFYLIFVYKPPFNTVLIPVVTIDNNKYITELKMAKSNIFLMVNMLYHRILTDFVSKCMLNKIKISGGAANKIN